MIQWAYKGPLRFVNAEHLCSIYSLATTLGMDELASMCIGQLTSAMHKALDNAKINNISMRNVLEETFSAINRESQANLLTDIVPAMFWFVLQHKNPPVELKTVILEAIADSADLKLVSLALPMMRIELKDELCIALARCHWKAHSFLCSNCPNNTSAESKAKMEKSRGKGASFAHAQVCNQTDGK